MKSSGIKEGQPTTVPASAGAEPPARKTASWRKIRSLKLIFFVALLWLFLSVTTRSFFTVNNIENLVRQTAVIQLVAVGQTFVMITGGIDLSVGSVIGLAGVIAAMLMKAGIPIWLSIILTVIFGCGVGLINGVLVTRAKLPPFIVTLAGLTVYRGAALLITNARIVSGLPKDFTRFANADFLGVPSLFVVVLVFGMIGYLVLHRSVFGRYLFAVGSNREAARLSGIKTEHVLLGAYLISGVCAAVAGLIMTSRLSVAAPTTGQMNELDAIASAVIGGTSLFGASGTILGTLTGALLLSTINNGANLLNVNPFWQPIIAGLLIVIVVYFDQVRKR
jgi:ribose transport system permease protein